MKKEEDNRISRISRRKALSTGAKIGIAAGTTLVVGSVAGYFSGVSTAPGGAGQTRTITETRRETVTLGAQTVTRTVTVTGQATPAVEKIEGRTPEERVFNGLQALIRAGKLQRGTVITFLHDPGARGHYPAVNPDYFKPFLDAAQGYVTLKDVEVRNEDVVPRILAESVEKSGAYDLFAIIPSADTVDLVETGVILDITDYIQKYDPELFSGPCPWPEQFVREAGFYKGRWWGLRIDYDVWILHYRADIYGDKEIKREFEDRYGYPLRPPVTWKEFLDQSEFFYRPDEPPRTKLNLSDTPGFYPTWEYKVPFWEIFNINLRWWTTGWPFFDRQMNPTIKKPEVIKAFNDMVEAQRFQPRESFTAYWDVGYPMYQSGKMAFLISWTSLLKFSNVPESAVRGRVALDFCPGYPLKGSPDQVGISRAAVRTVGYIAASYTMAVNRYSKNPELAYLMLQYYTSPKYGSIIVADPSGYYEPNRLCHFVGGYPGVDFKTLIEDQWGAENLRIMYDNLDYLAPDIRLPGKPRYIEVLDREMNAVLQGRQSVETAADKIEREWNKITDEIGREKQIAAWNEVLDTMIGPKLKNFLKV